MGETVKRVGRRADRSRRKEVHKARGWMVVVEGFVEGFIF